MTETATAALPDDALEKESAVNFDDPAIQFQCSIAIDFAAKKTAILTKEIDEMKISNTAILMDILMRYSFFMQFAYSKGIGPEMIEYEKKINYMMRKISEHVQTQR